MNLFFFTNGLFETFYGRDLRAHHGRTLTGPLTVGLFEAMTVGGFNGLEEPITVGP